MGSVCSICVETNPAFTATGGSVDQDSEKTISVSEKKCPISKKSPSVIKNILKEEGNKGNLSWSQLKRAGGKLGLDKIDLQNPDSPVCVFLNSLGDGDYTKELIVILAGILISNTSDKEKASVLFESYDEETGILTRSKIESLLSDLFDISINKLPNLAGSTKIVREAILTYTKKIAEFKSNFVSDTIQLIMQDLPEVGKGIFVELIQKNLNFVVNSSQLRTEVYRRYPITR
jgi:hypothetical protein